MSETLRKRGREPEALPDSSEVRESKRFKSEETDLFGHVPLLDNTLAEEEERVSTVNFVSGVMRSLEEEISATCPTFCTPISEDNSSALDISSCHEGPILFSDSDIDLRYLLEASDDELGIPSSPVLDSMDEFCQSPKETLTTEGVSESPDLKCQGENWDFGDEFENYEQFALFEDAWDANQFGDYMNRDFVSQDMFFDGNFSGAWTLEMAGYI